MRSPDLRRSWAALLLGLLLGVGIAPGAAAAPQVEPPPDAARSDELAAEAAAATAAAEAAAARAAAEAAEEAAATRAQAEATAEDVRVTEVIERLAEENDVGERLRGWRSDSVERMRRLLAATPLLLIAGGIVALFWWLGRRLSRGRWGPLRRKDANPFLAGLAAQAIQLAFVLIGLLIALQLLDALALAGALIGSAGVVGIAVGFAFRDLAENYIASILLSLKQPFAPDDSVVIDGNEGVVVGLTSRATLLMTPDGNHLRLPNALVFKAVILNHTRNGKRRFGFDMRLAPEADIDAALREALAAVKSVPGVLAAPAPFVQIGNADQDWIVLQCFGWADQREANFGWCRSEAIRRVRGALIAAGISFRRPVQRWQQCGEPEPVPVTSTAPAPAPPKAEHHAVAEAIAESRRELGGEDLLSAAAPRE